MAYEDRDHGLHGGEFIDDTAAHTGSWHAIQVVGGTAEIDDGGSTTSLDNVAALDGLTLAEGTILRGRWTQITLVSGVVVAYKASESDG